MGLHQKLGADVKHADRLPAACPFSEQRVTTYDGENTKCSPDVHNSMHYSHGAHNKCTGVIVATAAVVAGLGVFFDGLSPSNFGARKSEAAGCSLAGNRDD